MAANHSQLPEDNGRGGLTTGGRDDQRPWRIISLKAALASNHSPLTEDSHLSPGCRDQPEDPAPDAEDILQQEELDQNVDGQKKRTIFKSEWVLLRQPVLHPNGVPGGL